MKNLKFQLILPLLISLAGCASGPRTNYQRSDRSPSSSGFKLKCVADRGARFNVMISNSLESITVCEGTTAGVESCDGYGSETILKTRFVKTDDNGGRVYEGKEEVSGGNASVTLGSGLVDALQNGTHGVMPGGVSYNYFSGAGNDGNFSKECTLK